MRLWRNLLFLWFLILAPEWIYGYIAYSRLPCPIRFPTNYITGISITLQGHYNDVLMTTLASQLSSLTVVYSTVYSDADQRKHQSSASLAFVRGIHRDRWISRTKGKLRGKCSHLMTSSWNWRNSIRSSFGSHGGPFPMRTVSENRYISIIAFIRLQRKQNSHNSSNQTT